MRIFTLTAAIIFSSITSADWTLQEPSSVHFLTSKNMHNTEAHNFKKFDAKIKSNGQAVLNIDLTSVDTRITIRDERMIEHLFEVSRFGNASFTADIPADVLKQASAGKSIRHELKGKISLHGELVTAYCDVMISQNIDKTIAVNSLTPMILDGNDFNLVAGINKLRDIAGLKSITHTVPVTFNLTFKAD